MRIYLHSSLFLGSNPHSSTVFYKLRNRDAHPAFWIAELLNMESRILKYYFTIYLKNNNKKCFKKYQEREIYPSQGEIRMMLPISPNLILHSGAGSHTVQGQVGCYIIPSACSWTDTNIFLS